MKTPYSHIFNFSIQRELPGGFVLEMAYIGRLGRNQLQQIDLAQPLDLVDKLSGQDYYAAATQLSKQKYAGATTVGAIPYFENMQAIWDRRRFCANSIALRPWSPCAATWTPRSGRDVCLW